ncbi:MAG TPA: hypothetical protein VH120_07625 [Gemmataceae bacterium]|jgi:hypothetical protein|nr:hypothetical protein [Gemmataceae bacterium]
MAKKKKKAAEKPGTELEGSYSGVTKTAVIRRINRKLRDEERLLKAARSPRDRATFGEYYVVGINRGGILEHHISLEEIGRRTGALKSWECVIRDENEKKRPGDASRRAARLKQRRRALKGYEGL